MPPDPAPLCRRHASAVWEVTAPITPRDTGGQAEPGAGRQALHGWQEALWARTHRNRAPRHRPGPSASLSCDGFGRLYVPQRGPDRQKQTETQARMPRAAHACAHTGRRALLERRPGVVSAPLRKVHGPHPHAHRHGGGRVVSAGRAWAAGRQDTAAVWPAEPPHAAQGFLSGPAVCQPTARPLPSWRAGEKAPPSPFTFQGGSQPQKALPAL